MALVSDPKLRKSFSIKRSTPLLLRDYLRDDLSSCSSNGFKSFPRRECCATVRLLLEIDLKAKSSNRKSTKRLLPRSRSKAASTTISALQKASEAVLNAVKRLQFPSVKSPSSSVQGNAKKGILSRSFSRKLLKRSFSRKADRKGISEQEDIKRWKSFREFLEEKHPPSDEDEVKQCPTVTPISKCVSTTSSSSKSNRNSWSESDFTVASSGNSESSSENDAVVSKKVVQSSDNNKSVSNGVGVSVGLDSVNSAGENTKAGSTATKVERPASFQRARHSRSDWPNEEEKEQFSPVSVLDFPFEDENEINSPFQSKLARMEGTKKKLMQNIRRFESLTLLEPVNLQKRIALSELNIEPCSVQKNNKELNYVEENEAESKVEDLLTIMKLTTPCNSVNLVCNGENLLSDFFKARIEENNTKNWVSKMGCNNDLEKGILKEAQDWVNGETRDLWLGWEEKEGRMAYIRDMEEKIGWWRNHDLEKEEVVLALEIEVFTSLVNELALDLY